LSRPNLIGALFNDVVAKSFGGINATTAPDINREITAIQKDLKQLIASDPEDFHGLPLVHTQAIIAQLSLEKQYNNQAGATTVSARGPADTLLDIIDIVQGDDVLASLATANGANGWRLRRTPPRIRQDTKTMPSRPISGPGSSPARTPSATPRPLSSTQATGEPSTP